MNTKPKPKESARILGLLLAIAPALSGASGIVGPATVSEIMSGGYTASGKGWTRVRFRLAHANPDSCTEAKYVALEVGEANYADQFALVLAAIREGLPVTAYVAGCTADDKYAIVSRLSIRND